MQTQPQTPIEFTIRATSLTNMYESLERCSKGPVFITESNRISGYKSGVEVQFNAFKIFFKQELEALGLNTETT